MARRFHSCIYSHGDAGRASVLFTRRVMAAHVPLSPAAVGKIKQRWCTMNIFLTGVVGRCYRFVIDDSPVNSGKA